MRLKLTPWIRRDQISDMDSHECGHGLVSLLFWGWIWGVWGLLLAIPITAAMKTVCERIPDFSAVAELLKE